ICFCVSFYILQVQIFFIQESRHSISTGFCNHNMVKSNMVSFKGIILMIQSSGAPTIQALISNRKSIRLLLGVCQFAHQ
ncbi:hypothetical protein M8C21_020744, partial [Ambrosia artemisiifolia]